MLTYIHIIHVKVRSIHRRCFVRKGVLRNFVKSTGKHLCQSLFFNKVAGLRPATLLKKRLWHRCFPLNFAKFLRTPFLQNTSGRLLLESDLLPVFQKRFAKGFSRWSLFNSNWDLIPMMTTTENKNISTIFRSAH